MNLNEKLAKEAANAYQRQWRKAHREKIKEYNTRYWTKKALQAEAQKGVKNDAED